MTNEQALENFVITGIETALSQGEFMAEDGWFRDTSSGAIVGEWAVPEIADAIYANLQGWDK